LSSIGAAIITIMSAPFVETPVQADKQKTVTATPSWDGHDIAAEDSKKANKGDPPPTLSLSYGFLLVALLFFFVSGFSTAFLVLGKLDGKIKLDWKLIFLPCWIANGFVVVCHFGSFISALMVANTVRKRYSSEHFPTLFKGVKTLTYWTTCENFFGVLPSLVSLGLIWWLESNVFHWLESKQVFKFSALLPLFLLFALSIVREVFGGKGSTLSAILIICLTITCVLVPGKAEGTYFTGVTWMLALSPLLFVLCCFMGQVLWVMYNHIQWGRGGVVSFTSNTQIFGAILYLCGSTVMFVGVMRVTSLLASLKPGAPAVATGDAQGTASLPLIGMSLIAFGIYLNACRYTGDLIDYPDDPTRVPVKTDTVQKAIDFNEEDIEQNPDASASLLGGEGSASSAAASIGGEEDWYYYGRMKVMARDRWSGLSRPKIDTEDQRGCGCCGRMVDKIFGL